MTDNVDSRSWDRFSVVHDYSPYGIGHDLLTHRHSYKPHGAYHHIFDFIYGWIPAYFSYLHSTSCLTSTS